jgi:hypothetical protein
LSNGFYYRFFYAPAFNRGRVERITAVRPAHSIDWAAGYAAKDGGFAFLWRNVDFSCEFALTKKM